LAKYSNREYTRLSEKRAQLEAAPAGQGRAKSARMGLNWRIAQNHLRKLDDNCFFKKDLNPCGKSDQLIVHLNMLKMAERSEAKNTKRSFASKSK